MDTDQIKLKVKCCVSGDSLKDSKHLNAIQTNYLATWDYPTAGNILTGEKGFAMAFVHDRHITKRGNLKWVVEFQGDEVIYHELSGLVKLEENLPPSPPDDNRFNSSEMFFPN
jgi:hypothetical protein